MSSGDNLDRQSDPLSRAYAEGDLIAQKYRLEGILGEGGMGMVWVARNEALDSRVALKLIRSDLNHPEAAGRLLKEARAAARLEHRGIVRVYDYGQTEHGDPFIVMELLDGRSFGAVLERHARLSAVRAVQTLLPVVDALAFAHKHGIVHRDLKPDNIFMARQTKRTQPKVVDFGIAKFEQAGAKRDLTSNGTVLGSPGYMSPEQARGISDVDHRADVWAVCVVLYEAVTGRVPFDGDNYNAMMRSIIEDDPLPITAYAAGDDELWSIVERGMRKDRGARWQTMRELGKALAEWLLRGGVDRDVAGESLEQAWLSEVEDTGRDVFSAPPPSSEAALSIGRLLRKEENTLSRQSDDDLLAGVSLRPSRVPGGLTVPPSSASTGGVVSSSRPESARGSSRAPFAFLGSLAILGFGALTAWYLIREDATAEGAAATVAAKAAKPPAQGPSVLGAPLAPAPVAVGDKVAAPAPAPEPAAALPAAAPAAPAAPPSTSSPVAPAAVRTRPGSPAQAAPVRSVRSTASKPGARGSTEAPDLKDPYQ